MQIFVNSNYDFVKWRYVAVIVSLVVIAAGAAVLFTQGINLGIDFRGGASVILKFQQAVPLDQLRSTLPDATIQQYGKSDDNAALIRLPQRGQEGDYAGQVVTMLNQKMNPESAAKHDLNYQGRDRLASLLKENDPDVKGTNPVAQEHYNTTADRIISRRSDLGIFTSMQQVTSVPGVSAATSRLLADKAFLGKFNLLSQETVGPQVGAQLQRKAMWAIVLSAIAMAVYIGLRFEQGLTFGLAGFICIVHDVLIAMAFLVVMRLEFSLNVVAALLTIVGYSINDTVVMYDRVRENKRKTKTKLSLAEHLNRAINDTMSRTVLTAGSVFLVLLALLALGGEVIRGFTWVLLIGVISGTYSTLLIVPAFAVAWEKWRGPKESPAALRADATRDETAPRKRKAS